MLTLYIKLVCFECWILRQEYRHKRKKKVIIIALHDKSGYANAS